MRILRSPLARRLMLALMLLTLVPVAVFAGFVQRTVSMALFDLAAKDVQAQARILAASIPPGFEASLTTSLLEGSLGMGTEASVVSRDGRYLAHPDRARVGQPALDDYLEPTIEAFFAGPSGVIHELASGRLIGYAALPGREAVAIVASNRAAVEDPLAIIRLAAAAQMALGLAVVAVVGGAIIWRVTGPIQTLIEAAERIGAGDLDIALDSGRMDGELQVLAVAIEQMSARLSESYDALERQVVERTESLATVNAIADLVSRSPELERVLSATLAGVMEALQVQSGAIFVRHPSTGALEIAEQKGLTAPLLEMVRQAPLARRAVADLEAVVINDTASDRGAPPQMLASEFRSVASIPLIAQGRAVGALTVACTDAGRFPPQAVDLLVTIGNQIGVAVENARLYAQARQLATLEERQRLARDLHDAVSQSLYGVSLYAEAASRMLRAGRAEDASESLDQLRVTAADAIKEMRLLIFELRPPILQQSGLDGALRTRLEAVERRAGLTTELVVDAYERQPAAVEEALYRIAQEALNNALKHAEASRIELRLRQSSAGLTLEILDDGRGFDPARMDAGGIGLASMRERAERLGAAFEVGDRPEGGGRVAVTLTFDS